MKILTTDMKKEAKKNPRTDGMYADPSTWESYETG